MFLPGFTISLPSSQQRTLSLSLFKLWVHHVELIPPIQAPYHPTFAVNGSLFAGVFGGDGLVSLEMPCGTMEAEA